MPARLRQPGDDDSPATAGPPVVAAIDIGSNSIKMTVARLVAGGAPDEFDWASETVRLGAGLDTTGCLAEDRIEAALAVLAGFAERARRLGARRIVAVATEATRVAANGGAFLDRVRRETGIEVRPIDGDEEARLTFLGLAATTDIAGEAVVADVGGASTEIIAATDGAFRGARSIPLGSGRLTDRFFRADPPTAAEVAACRVAAADALVPVDRDLGLRSGATIRVFVVGGTGEYLGRLVVDEQQITPEAVDGVLARLTRVTAEALAEELGIAVARARVLPAGVAVVAALADQLRPRRIEVARSGIRTGLLLEALDEQDGQAGAERAGQSEQRS